jgi:hypothetical protein
VSGTRSTALFIVVGLAVALALAFLVAPHASTSPDGLMKVAERTSIDRGAVAASVTHAPLSNYRVAGVADPGLSRGVAGAIGIVLTFVITIVTARWIARRHRIERSTTVSPETQTA